MSPACSLQEGRQNSFQYCSHAQTDTWTFRSINMLEQDKQFTARSLKQLLHKALVLLMHSGPTPANHSQVFEKHIGIGWSLFRFSPKGIVRSNLEQLREQIMNPHHKTWCPYPWSTFPASIPNYGQYLSELERLSGCVVFCSRIFNLHIARGMATPSAAQLDVHFVRNLVSTSKWIYSQGKL